VVEQNQDPTEAQVQQAVDSISQDQEQLDQEQAIATQPQPVTLEMMQQFFQQQMQPFVSQVQGLHSKVDTGLNAVRRDVTAEAKQLVENVTADIGKRQFLASLDEDQRPLAEGLMAQMEARMPEQQFAAQQPMQAQTTQQDPWESIYKYVESHGVVRNNPNVNYAILSDMSLTDIHKGQLFNNSIFQARTAQSQQAAPPRQTQQAQSNGQGTVNPPVERNGSLSQNPLRTEEDIVGAFIADQFISPEDPDGKITFRAKMAAIGKQY
jgi:hypothetical protein